MKITFPEYPKGRFTIIEISIHTGWTDETTIEIIFLNKAIDITFIKR